MKCRALVTALCLVTSFQLPADWSETGIWVPSTAGETLVSISFVQGGTLFYALRNGDEVIVITANWEYKPELCRTDEIAKDNLDKVTARTIETGNLMILSDGTDCCLNAERTGEYLALSKIWIEGDNPLISELCTDIVLSRK